MGRSGRGIVDEGSDLGVIVACLIVGRAAAAESAAEAIRAFGLTGTWSVDCTTQAPYQACNRNNRCGARIDRTWFRPSGSRRRQGSVIGTFTPGQVIRTFIERRSIRPTRIADDKIKIVSVHRRTGTPSARHDLAQASAGRGSGRSVLLKVGDKYRTFSAHRDDWHQDRRR